MCFAQSTCARTSILFVATNNASSLPWIQQPMWARARALASQLSSFFFLGSLPWWLFWFQQCPFFSSSKAIASPSFKGMLLKLTTEIAYSWLFRMVVRIMVMVPLYAISSLVSLFSLEAAFVIDAIRDIYEVSICIFHYPTRSTLHGSWNTPSGSCNFPVAWLDWLPRYLAVCHWQTRALGLCDLLLFRVVIGLPWRRAFTPYPFARTTTQTTCLPRQYIQAGNWCQWPVHFLIPKERNTTLVLYFLVDLFFI